MTIPLLADVVTAINTIFAGVGLDDFLGALLIPFAFAMWVFGRFVLTIMRRKS